MRRVLLLTAAGLTLASCDMFEAPSGGADAPPAERRSEPAANAFSHSQSDDISGEYRVIGEASGNRLSRLHIGQIADFEAWESGRRSGGFAPVMLDVQADSGTMERVLPDAYSVNDGQVRMTGRSDRLGPVSFTGRLDKGALATARRNLGEAEAASMTGTVTIDGATRSGLKLNWYGGD